MRLMRALITACLCLLALPSQTFDGKEGREKYPKRWVVFPPLL